MPRLFNGMYDYDDEGSVVIERPSPACADVFYTPSHERLNQADIENSNRSDFRAKLLHIDGHKQSLTIFPINALPSAADSDAFLQQKYTNIKTITIENWPASASNIQEIVFPGTEVTDEMIANFGYSDQEVVMMILEDLPSCFIKDYDYGLGFTRPYRFIVDAVESLSQCTEIIISNRSETGIDPTNQKFNISIEDLEAARKAINRTNHHSQNAAKSVNYAATRNLFADRIGKPAIPVKTGRSPLRKLLTDAAIRGNKTLTEDEQDEMLDILTVNAKSLAEDKPRRLANVKADIEIVSLEDLIRRYRDMMKARKPEKKWQEFLNGNPFILSLAFGYPVVKVRDQASVGGHKISRGGETIADFLVKNSLTNNCAIIEIKTPQTRLLNKSTYRGSVFSPSSHLVGAVNQALQQKRTFEREISVIKDNSKIYDIESYTVSCCLIVGTMPKDDERQQSFELFRGNSKNVQVVTFDELLHKMTNLINLLKSSEVEVNAKSEQARLPF